MFTPLAIPGWATTVFGDLVIVLMQTIVMVVATGLLVLGNRSYPPHYFGDRCGGLCHVGDVAPRADGWEA